MTKILEFPNHRVGRGRIKAVIQKALESHAPSTQGQKLEEVMDIYDRYSITPTSVTIMHPEAQPFTDEQVDCINAALDPLVSSFIGQIREAVLEIIRLKLAVIDLEK